MTYKCIKCGSTDIALSFHPSKQDCMCYCVFPKKDIPVGEHMACQCNNCYYEFIDLPLDRK